MPRFTIKELLIATTLIASGLGMLVFMLHQGDSMWSLLFFSSAVGRRNMQDGFGDLVNRPACAPRLNWNDSIPSGHLDY